MENYRPYREVFEIDFAHGDEAHDGKNLTIIVGGNDFGKTNFLNAISWCIYDKEPYKESTKKTYNQSAAQDLPVGGTLEVYVEVIIENNEGDDILYRRSQIYKKRSDGVLNKVGDSKFEIKNLSDKDNYKIMDCESYRNTNFPDALQQYFLFDGERLLEWLKSDSGSLKSAVQRLSHCDLIVKVKDNTKTQLDILADELKELNYTKGINKKKQIELNDIIEMEKGELEKVEGILSDLNNDKQNLEFFIYRNGGDNSRNLKKDIDNLEKDIERYQKQLTNLNEKKLKYLTDSFYLVSGYPYLKNILLMHEENENSKPPVEHEYSISPEDIDFLLNKKECICGNHLIEEDGSIDNLKLFKDKLSNISPKSPEEIELGVLNDKSKDLINEFPVDFKDKMTEIYQEITDLEEVLNDKEDELEDKKDEYQTLLNANIPEKLKELNRIEKSIIDLEVRKESSKENIRKSKEELTEVEKNLLIDISKEGTKSKIDEKISFCENIISICDDLETKFMDSLYNELDQVVNEEFQNIYNREGDRGKYKKISIDESFEITFEEFDGINSSSSDPSSGTQLALAVSFITAINLSSGYKLPQIMDTSLGRWDNTLRRNFALTLPDYLENIQMVFLFLDSEFNEEFEDLISDYIGVKHTLIRKNNNETLLKPKGD